MFRLSGHDNGFYFFEDRADVKRCPVCNGLVDKWGEDLGSVPLPHFPRYDLSYSYDGVLVATQRFKGAVESAGLTGMVFQPLQRDVFAARPRATVPIDAARLGTRFENRCESCGQYESVVGASPVFLMPGASVPARGFVRTDLEFGSDDEKSPVILCGDEAAHELRRAKLRRLELLPAGSD